MKKNLLPLHFGLLTKELDETDATGLFWQNFREKFDIKLKTRKLTNAKRKK